MKKLAESLTDELDAMWRFALRLTSIEADAEDLVQRTCVKALETESQYEEKGRLRSWLFCIEHRIWLNVLRARQIRHAGSFNNTSLRSGSLNSEFFERQHTADCDNTDSHQLSALLDTPESQLQLHQIFVQVESLPEAQRLVMILVCVEGFTYRETAEILDIPTGTVMSRLARARITLGKAMQVVGEIAPEVEIDRGLQ